MGNQLRVVNDTSRSTGRLLPRVSGAAVDPQRACAAGLPVMAAEGERLARVEGKLEAYDAMFNKMADALEGIKSSLATLVSLEERHQALDRRHEELRLDYKRMLDQSSRVDARIRSLENDTGLNSHIAGVWEKLAIPITTSIISSLIVAAVVYMLFRVNSGAF